MDKDYIVLASQSPRRRQLLKDAGISFKVIKPDVMEEIMPEEKPVDACVRLAQEKAENVASSVPARTVLAADTLVCIDGEILGKPESEAQAAEMLAKLSGRSHWVITGVCLCRQSESKKCCWSSLTRVDFYDLTDADIKSYLKEVNTLDKAGAYAIQESGEMLVRNIEGLRSNVVGLPIEEVCDKLKIGSRMLY